jgi:adenylylsulfate kinase
MVIWITGRAAAGKTTLANKLKQVVNRPVLIDGDEVRKQQNNSDYSDEGRLNNIIEIASRAKEWESVGYTVIVACVSPTRILRDKARALFKESVLIYVPGGTLWPGTNYEEPTEDEIKS